MNKKLGNKAEGRTEIDGRSKGIKTNYFMTILRMWPLLTEPVR